MPELPEVETTRLGISPHIIGKKIRTVIIRAPKLRWPIPAILKTALKNKTIEKIERRAKYLLLHIGNGQLIIHLGMSGRIQILKPNHPIGKHDHFELHFSDCIMRLTDPRRFGAVLWHEQLSTHPLLIQIGPEPLDREFNGKYLFEKLARKNITIKVAIMDQKVVAGVGNIYACESLFLSKISPFRLASSLDLKECTTLVKQIKKVLRLAIKQGGTTLQDFKQSDGKPGYFKQHLYVYDRTNEACYQCLESIEVAKLGQRSTFYCPNCQPAK